MNDEPLEDEQIETDIAGVIEDWFARGHDVFSVDEVCAAYVQAYKTARVEVRAETLREAAALVRDECGTANMAAKHLEQMAGEDAP